MNRLAPSYHPILVDAFHANTARVNGLDELYKKLYKLRMGIFEHVEFRGSALDDLRAFPVLARREAGYQLDQVQQGREADDWKPMNTVGSDVREIRIRDEAGAFRVIYVAKFSRALYVLHCFQKKTQQPVNQTSTWQRNATGIYARSLNNEP